MRNYRSTPQVLALANRLLAAEGRTKRLDGDARRRPGAHDQRVTRRRTRSCLALAAAIRERLGGGDRPVGDRGPRAHERAARADRGGADAGGHRVPRARASGSTTARRCAAPVRPSVASRRSTSTGSGSWPPIRAALDGRARRTRPDGDVAEGDEAQERQAILDTLLAIVGEARGGDPTSTRRRRARGARRAGRPRTRRARRTA